MASCFSLRVVRRETIDEKARTEARIAKKKASSLHSRNRRSRQSVALVWQNWKHCNQRQVGANVKEVIVSFGAQKRRVVRVCKKAGKLT